MLPGNGKMKRAEFEEMMASQMDEPITPDALRIYFKQFDQNGDGFITRDELALALKNLTEKEIDDLIVEADKDSDGKISYEGTARDYNYTQKTCANFTRKSFFCKCVHGTPIKKALRMNLKFQNR